MSGRLASGGIVDGTDCDKILFSKGKQCSGWSQSHKKGNSLV